MQSKTAIAERYRQSPQNLVFVEQLLNEPNTKRIAIGITLVGFNAGDDNHHKIENREVVVDYIEEFLDEKK